MPEKKLVFETKITRKGEYHSYQTAVPKVIMQLFEYPTKIRWLVDLVDGKVCIEFKKEAKEK